MFRVFFFSQPYTYIRFILRAITHGCRDQETYFFCEKLLRLYAIEFCNQLLPNFHCWWSGKFCSQQHLFKLLELVMYWNPCKRLVTNWRFVHQCKEAYYKIKSNWVLERRFNCRLLFWNRPGQLVRFLILVTTWLLLSGFLGVVTLKSPDGVFLSYKVFSHLSTNHRVKFNFSCV